MDVQYQAEKDECETPECENEYQLEIKIQSLQLEDGKPEDIQFVFVFGDLVNRMTAEGESGFDGQTKEYTVHSTPIALAEKLLNAPIMISVVSTADLKPLGKIIPTPCRFSL